MVQRSAAASSTRLSPRETSIIDRLHELKTRSGSHSPSLNALRDTIPGLDIRVDACFLSNPYATDLFVERLSRDLLDTGELRSVLESYPSPNGHIASVLEPAIEVDREHIFACNGAVEAIQVALHRFAGRRVGVIVPTFSPYHEYLRPDQKSFLFRLSSDCDFTLDIQVFLDFVRRNQLDTVALVNPNNPNGGYIPAPVMSDLLSELRDLQLVILDESFVDFAYEDDALNRRSLAADVAGMPNVVLVKSMSKDFGIAGVRAGYAVMSPSRVASLLANGYLWNVGGLAEFFFRLLGEPRFHRDYVAARVQYLHEALPFFDALGHMPGLRAFPTKANFCLVRLDTDISITLVVPLLLIRHGIYVRDCRDKIGLEDGEYIRIASRKRNENDQILTALRQLLPECHLGRS